MTRPCDAPVTLPFGATYGSYTPSNPHKGVDYGCGLNTPLKAAIGGTVTYVGNQSGYGKFIEWQGDNGRFYLYAHMNRQDVGVGQRVSEGQVLGLSGSTGYSTGPHVHVVEAGGKTNNQLVNLMDFEKNNFNQGGMKVADENFINNVYFGVLMRKEAPYDVQTKTWRDAGAAGFVGKPCDVVLQSVMDSTERDEVEKQYNGSIEYTEYQQPQLYMKKEK